MKQATKLTGLNKYQKGHLISSPMLSMKNQFLVVETPIKIYQVILIYGIFSASFPDNLE